jgi:hypothetical protein
MYNEMEKKGCRRSTAFGNTLRFCMFCTINIVLDSSRLGDVLLLC